jgi:hypothetical protein
MAMLLRNEIKGIEKTGEDDDHIFFVRWRRRGIGMTS